MITTMKIGHLGIYVVSIELVEKSEIPCANPLTFQFSQVVYKLKAVWNTHVAGLKY
jgi:hypothetical protein